MNAAAVDPCLDEDALLGFASGILAKEQVAEVERHIDACGRCRQVVAALAQTSLGDRSHERIGALASASLSSSSVHSLSEGRAEPRDAPPRRVGRYELRELVGAGGMGLVYAAHDTQLKRKIALKVLRGDREQGAAARARVLREAQAMARLAHPNVIHVYDVGELEGEVFIAMEFVAGETLGRAVAGRRSWRETLDLFLQAGEGLKAAHEAGIIHRDFKPDNVLVGTDGRVRVSDFGIARSGDSPSVVNARGDAAVDVTSAIAGTPAYMAPEQMRGGRVDARADVFSFSVALYEALYGMRPFAGKNILELLSAIDEGRVTSPSGSLPPLVSRTRRVPPWLHRCVTQGFSSRPEQRFATMDAMLHAMKGPRFAWRRRGVAAVAATLIVSAVFMAALLRAGARDVRDIAIESTTAAAPSLPPLPQDPLPATSAAPVDASSAIDPSPPPGVTSNAPAPSRPPRATPPSAPLIPPAVASTVAPSPSHAPSATPPPSARSPLDIFNEPR